LCCGNGVRSETSLRGAATARPVHPEILKRPSRTGLICCAEAPAEGYSAVTMALHQASTESLHDDSETAPAPRSLRADVCRQLRSMATVQAAVFAAVEVVWASTHLSLYPFGARRPRRGPVGQGYRIEHLSPMQRGMFVSGVTELGTPILLLHGLADNH